MTDPSEVLLQKTTDFATDLAGTVSAFVGREWAFVATVRDAKVHISLEGSAGIPLQVAGSAHLTMVIEMECSWDSAHKYLAIDESKLQVFPGARTNKEPLFRYEYVREPVGGPPAVSNFHFPLGGPRFRPCLEDILETLWSSGWPPEPAGRVRSLRDACVGDDSR